MRFPHPIMRFMPMPPLWAALLVFAGSPAQAGGFRATGTGDAPPALEAPLATAPPAHGAADAEPLRRFLLDAVMLREAQGCAREAGRGMAAGVIAAPHHAADGTTFTLRREGAAPLRFRATEWTLILIRAADGLRVGKPGHLRAGWRCEAAWDLPPSSDDDMDKAPRPDGDAILLENLIADPSPR